MTWVLFLTRRTWKEAAGLPTYGGWLPLLHVQQAQVLVTPWQLVRGWWWNSVRTRPDFLLIDCLEEPQGHCPGPHGHRDLHGGWGEMSCFSWQPSELGPRY